MSQSGGIWFVCSRCFSSNRPEAMTCHVCGHRLDAIIPRMAAGASSWPVRPRAREPFDPDASPAGGISPGVTFRISSLLMVIAVIGVCLGIARESLGVGISLAIVVVPAFVFTIIAAARRRARSSPMVALDLVRTFFIAMVAVVFIEVSTLVAMFWAGLLVVYVTGSSEIALVIGSMTGIATGGSLMNSMLSRKGENPRRAGSS
jgi:hypothetical protein